MINAAEYDDLIIKLAAIPGFRDAVRAYVGAAYCDQLDTAFHQSVAAAETIANKSTKIVEHRDVPDWLRLGALDTVLKWMDGKGKTCSHAPTYQNPEPVWSAAWKPGLVVCSACTHLLKVVGDADMTCDCCGRICDDVIRAQSVWIGALAYHAGVCSDCYEGAQK